MKVQMVSSPCPLTGYFRKKKLDRNEAKIPGTAKIWLDLRTSTRACKALMVYVPSLFTVHKRNKLAEHGLNSIGKYI